MGRSWCGTGVGSGHSGAPRSDVVSAPAGTAACGKTKMRHWRMCMCVLCQNTTALPKHVGSTATNVITKNRYMCVVGNYFIIVYITIVLLVLNCNYIGISVILQITAEQYD